MKRHALTLMIATAIAVPVFAIVNGELDTENDHPNVCAILSTEAPGGGDIRQAISSGTLVHPRVVMTAGHTVVLIRNLVANPNNSIELEDIVVDFAPDAHDGVGTDYAIDKTYLHSGYHNRDASSIDVGLIILKEEVAGITPVNLPTAGYLDDLDPDRGPSDSKPSLIVAGYGNTEAAPADGSLPKGKRRIAESTFKSLRRTYLMLSQSFALGEGGISRGDSGAPAFWNDNGSLIQVAVMVNGDHASASYGSGVRTDIQTVLEFIDDAIDEVEAE
ncbi:MAG: trypsin-like serine peptidase [Planctomycetota bacterium]|jgi:hypothetical protein